MERAKWMLVAVVLLAWTGWGQVTPRADCATVDYGHNGSYPLFFNLWGDQQQGPPLTAYAQFGYFSYGNTTVPAGSNNQYFFLSNPGFATIQPPTTFTPGTHLNVFGGGFVPGYNYGWLLNQVNAAPDPSLPPCPAMVTGGTPFPPQFAPLGLANGQTIRINVLANRAGSCTGTLSFLNSSLSPINTRMVNLASGQAASLDLVGTSPLVSPGQRKQVVPQFVDSSGQYRSCQASVEVFTSSTGVTVASSKWIQPVYQYDFDMQGLSAGQTLRINVSSPAAGNDLTYCGAALSFTDSTGAPLGQTSSGGGVPFVSYLDLPSTSVPGLTGWAGGRVQVRPVLNTVAPQNNPNTFSASTGLYANGVLVNATCLASVEIFDTLSGLTRVLSKPEPVH